MKTVIAAAALLACFSASAACTGTGSYRFCTDDSGNSYNVNRIGNSTYVQGNNAQTGSNWSQETYRSGNYSNTTGRDADGNSWNSTTYKSPNGSTFTTGTDRKGNSFSRTCNQFGCF